MSATNLTKNLKLSQFVASDKPSWLGDVNGDNKKIDDGYGVLAGEISKANDTASSAKSQSDANAQTLTNVNSELEDYGNRITALEAGGGTEQLEQRLNTLSTDVESLQTRADTFEEKIEENVNSISSLKGRVDTLEPKVNTNLNNITSLTTTTHELSEKVQQHEVAITGLGSSLNTQVGKIQTLEQSSGNNQADISTLTGRVNTLETKSSPITFCRRVDIRATNPTTYVPAFVWLTQVGTDNATFYMSSFSLSTTRISQAGNGADLFTMVLPSDIPAPAIFGETLKTTVPVVDVSGNAGSCCIYMNYNTSNRVCTFYASNSNVSSSTGLIVIADFQIVTSGR